jgi:hypothetical protein
MLDHVRTPINEVDLTEALCELVKISPDAETARRRLETARQCYEVAVRLLDLHLSPEQMRGIRNRLDRIKLWLDSCESSSEEFVAK